MNLFNRHPEITVQELKERMDQNEPIVLLDVREPDEWDRCHIDGAVHIPMGQVAARHGELPSDRPIVCICHHGHRSARIQRGLIDSGFKDVLNLKSGIDAWSRHINPSVPIY